MDVEQGYNKEKYRGKLYALNDESNWKDMGTGFVQVTNQEDATKRRLVCHEESSSDVLYDQLVAEKEINYQLQGEGDRQAIIVWEDTVQRDWALSFQDPSGAKEIYKIISKGPEHEEQKRILPIPKFGELVPLSRLLCGIPPAQREAIAAECLSPAFIAGLQHSFHTAEDTGSEADLSALWHISKGIFLLSNQKLTERYLQRDLYEDIMGMLEYDDGLPEAKRTAHRQVLQTTVRFNEVVTFEDSEMLERIHLNFRLQYLKDCVLPRLLDDQAFMSLTAQIHGNISTILDHLKSRSQLLESLFGKIRQKDLTSLAFLQDACRLAKTSIPIEERKVLYETMVELKLFEVLSQFLNDADSSNTSPDSRTNARHVAVEILQLSAFQDPTHLRRYLTTRTESGEGPRLLRSLIRTMLTEVDQGVQSQIADMLKSVMDPTNLQERERDSSLDVFYGDYGDSSHQGAVLDELTAPLRNLNGKVRLRNCFGLQLICELLAFAVAKHGYRARSYMMRHGHGQQAMRLMAERPRFLQLAPLRFLSAMVRSEDDVYHRYLIKNSLFGPMFRSLSESLKPPSLGGNLFVSAALELLEHVRVTNIKTLVDHICKKHSAILAENRLKIKTFDGLISRHQQNLEYEAFPPDQHAAGGPIAGSAGRSRQLRVRSPGREDSDDDEAWFDEDDEPASVSEDVGGSDGAAVDGKSLEQVDEQVDGGAGDLQPSQDVLHEDQQTMGMLLAAGSPEQPVPQLGSSLKGLLGDYENDEDEEDTRIAEQAPADSGAATAATAPSGVAGGTHTAVTDGDEVVPADGDAVTTDEVEAEDVGATDAVAPAAATDAALSEAVAEAAPQPDGTPAVIDERKEAAKAKPQRSLNHASKRAKTA